MPRFKVRQNYSSVFQRGGSIEHLVLAEGDEIELDPEVAAFVEADAPGTLGRPPAPKREAEPKADRQVKQAPRSRSAG